MKSLSWLWPSLVIVAVGIVFAFTAVAQEERCENPDRIASALRVQGMDVKIVSDPEAVKRGLNFMWENGLPRTVQATGLLLVDVKTGLRVTFIKDHCAFGMTGMDARTSEVFMGIISAELPGRDA